MYQMMDLIGSGHNKKWAEHSGIDTLLETGWLACRTPRFRRDLLSHAVVKSFEADETLYRHGDTADGLYAVLSGSVVATFPADDGQDFAGHRAGAGFWLGDLAMLSDAGRLVTVVATCFTETLFVPAARIQDMLERNPKYYREFYALTHENMRTALRILANLAVTDGKRRLVLRLLHLDDTQEHAGGWLHLSQPELAQMAAMSVPTLQRNLKGLEEDGMVETGYGRIRILDKTRLINSCQS